MAGLGLSSASAQQKGILKTIRIAIALLQLLRRLWLISQGHRHGAASLRVSTEARKD